jgi:hypothetical protein
MGLGAGSATCGRNCGRTLFTNNAAELRRAAQGVFRGRQLLELGEGARHYKPKIT